MGRANHEIVASRNVGSLETLYYSPGFSKVLGGLSILLGVGNGLSAFLNRKELTTGDQTIGGMFGLGAIALGANLIRRAKSLKNPSK